jgi:hypothetical protein
VRSITITTTDWIVAAGQSRPDLCAVQNSEYFDGVFTNPINSNVRKTAEHKFPRIGFAAGPALLGKPDEQIYAFVDCDSYATRSRSTAMFIDIVAE